MKRFFDELGEPYSFCYSLHHGKPVLVECPKCAGPASITDNESIEMQCSHCFYSQTYQIDYDYTASGVCTFCERWFNESVTDKGQHHHKNVHIRCPYCQTTNQVPLNKKTSNRYSLGFEIRDGKDPLFQLNLYLLTHYRGKLIWALNHEHLNYLIDYISADLRVKPSLYIKRHASYRLPKYMKDAKNRDGIVKALHKLQHKYEHTHSMV